MSESTDDIGTHTEEVIVGLADRELAAMRRDGVDDPEAAEVAASDPIPANAADSRRYETGLRNERDAAQGLLDGRRRSRVDEKHDGP